MTPYGTLCCGELSADWADAFRYAASQRVAADFAPLIALVVGKVSSYLVVRLSPRNDDE